MRARRTAARRFLQGKRRQQGEHQAIIAIGKVVRRQAFVMSYSDVFLLVGVGLVLALLAALALKEAAGGSAAGAH